MRLVQLRDGFDPRVAVVEDTVLRLLSTHQTTYSIANAAIETGASMSSVAAQDLSGQTLDYDEVYNGASGWKITLPMFHPFEPSRCLVAGTGLTHKASAQNRDAMHEGAASVITDSMRMYQSGLEGGRPAAGEIGAQPEWFYKGLGSILRAHNEPLVVPPYAGDGGEEAEIAGIYVIDGAGTPRRAGFVTANEFSDHVMEKRSYLHLAPSKLRNCSIGPELVLDVAFDRVEGSVRVERGDRVVWSKALLTGESAMSHTLSNLEHHHFKYPAHRVPGDIHIHFFGAGAFSFGDGIRLEDRDIMHIEFKGFGRALRNPIRTDTSEEKLVDAKPI
ncbi:MAG TPA: AraD1 family protein [Bryobacteraceae bacterium]|nr:AraD1 family protein [Bryobacteraceae bacterium]